MTDDTPSPLNNVITIDDERIKSHLDRVVRGSVEETLNALLEARQQLANLQLRLSGHIPIFRKSHDTTFSGTRRSQAWRPSG